MDKKTIALVLIVSVFLLTMVSAVCAKADEENMVAKPSQEIGIAAVTEGVGYIFAGGLGPILILVIAFIIGMVISHVMFGGF